MLTFREIDYDKDLEEIIDLLNNNFDSKHSLSHFRWKHLENPFGPSYGLLALHENKIIGLRMFMKWNFCFNGKVFNAIRPVDTCTDHAHRGKGLFKKLTLEGIKKQETTFQLIFNTPNNNSKPGYLKMGWEENIPFEYKLGILLYSSVKLPYRIISREEVKIPQFYKPHNETNITSEYLKWRYRDPNLKIAFFEDGSLVFFRIKILKGVRTLILFDSLTQLPVKRLIDAICKKENLYAYYFLNNTKNKSLNTIFSFSRNSQTVVYKDDSLNIFTHLDLTLSDLDGKL